MRPELTGRRQARTVFFVALVLYLAAAGWLALDVQYYMGDALARTQGAQSVLFGREPNLSVMGFVFTPLTTIAQLPLTALSPFFPELTRSGLAGAVVSAVFMAGAAREVWIIARDRGAPTWFSACVTALFALNPMIVLYGAVGMSEAPFTFAVLWACRHLIRWTTTDDVHDLILAGIALAVAFLARYDAVFVAFTAALMVGALTWRRRARRGLSENIAWAVIDMLVLLWPIGLAVLTWSVASWLSTGDLLAQFTSTYGNSAIIEASGGGDTGAEAVVDALTRTIIVAPAVAVLLPAALWFAYRRRDPEPIIPIVLMGSVLVFQVVTYALGSTFGLLRFFLIGIALTAVLLVQCLHSDGDVGADRYGVAARTRLSAPSTTVLSAPGLVVEVLLVVASIPLTIQGMASRSWAPQEFALVQEIAGERGSVAEREDAEQVMRTFATEKRLADYIDSLGLNDGEILTSTTYGFAILTASTHQKQFVIPSDPDFVLSLNDPAAHGIKYILSSPAEGRGAVDPVNLRYPDIYDTGAGIATLELEAINEGDGQPDWRLYRVLGE